MLFWTSGNAKIVKAVHFGSSAALYKVNTMDIHLFEKNTPTKPGFYMWCAAADHKPEIIKVVKVPSSMEYGCMWDEYLADSRQGHNITRYGGYFSNELNFVCHTHKEI